MILVTGASGLLGASVVMQALATNRQVTGLCHRHSVDIKGAELHGVDLTDPTATRRLVFNLQPSSIIHCAAATDVDWCEDHFDEARKINVSAAAFLAKLAREIDADFVHISTDSIFDGQRGNYSETDIPKPINAYAESKWQAEQEVLSSNFSSLITRVNLYGWNVQKKASLAEWIFNQLKEGVEFRGFTDVFFCPMPANDLAEVLLEMLDRKLTGVYNIAGSQRISKFDFAVRLATVFGFDAGLVIPSSIAQAKLRAPRPRDTSLRTEKITQALGRTMPDVDSGLRRFRALREKMDAFQSEPCVMGEH